MQPNIVFLVTDQEAYYNHAAQRPHHDRLAQGGIRFLRAYSACPLCTPARRTMMTGLYPHTHGFITLDEKENTEVRDHGILYNLLAEQSYALYHYGKWHAGPGTAHDYGCDGFSYPHFGNPYITDEYRQYCAECGLPPVSFNLEHVFLEDVSPDEPEPGPGYRAQAHSLHPHVTGVMETPTATHEAQFLANLACDKLHELAAAGNTQPFFLRVDIWGPHAPYFAAQEFLNLYPPKSIEEYGNFRDDLSGKPSVYRKEWNRPLCENNRLKIPSALPWSEWQRILHYVYGQVTQVDAALGMILDTLDELGLSDNTLVIATADHGDAISSYGGHFGKEAMLSEEVLRVPFAMRWPERIKPGQVSHRLISTVDFPVTMLDAAGTTFNGPVDGCSLFDLLPDSTLQGNSWRDAVLCETHGHHWEPVVGRAVAIDQYRYSVYQYHGVPDYLDDGEVAIGQPIEELYNLGADPYQLNNLALDPAYAHVLEEHRWHLGELQTQTGDPIAFGYRSTTDRD